MPSSYFITAAALSMAMAVLGQQDDEGIFYCDMNNRVLLSNFRYSDDPEAPCTGPEHFSSERKNSSEEMHPNICGWLIRPRVREIALKATRITLTTVQGGVERSVWSEYPDALDALRSDDDDNGFAANWMNEAIVESWTKVDGWDWGWGNCQQQESFELAYDACIGWPEMYTGCTDSSVNWLSHSKVYSNVESAEKNGVVDLRGLTASSTWLTVGEGDCVQGWPNEGASTLSSEPSSETTAETTATPTVVSTTAPIVTADALTLDATKDSDNTRLIAGSIVGAVLFIMAVAIGFFVIRQPMQGGGAAVNPSESQPSPHTSEKNEEWRRMVIPIVSSEAELV